MRKRNSLLLIFTTAMVFTLLSVSAVVLILIQRTAPSSQLPSHADVYTYAQLANQLAEQGHYQQALEANSRALAYQPHQSDLLFNQAWLAASLGQWPVALDYLNRAKKNNPRDPQIAYTRAWVLQNMQRLDEMQSEIQRAQKLDWKPQNAYEQARVLQLQGQHQRAIQLFTRLINEQSFSLPRLHYWRGKSYLALYQTEPALADWQTSLSLQQDAYVYQERARLYEKLNQLDNALVDWQKSQTLEPELQTRLEIARLKIDFPTKEPNTELQQLSTLKPDWLPLQRLQLKALIVQRQSKPAAEMIAKLLKTHPKDPEIWFYKAMLLRNQRKSEPARAALKQAQMLGYDPQALELENLRLAVQTGQSVSVKQKLQQACQKNPLLKTQLAQDRILKKYLPKS